MNEKLYLLVRNLLLSIAISIIVYVCLGYIKSVPHYFKVSEYDSPEGTEIIEKYYRENIKDDQFIKRYYFNGTFAFPIGLVSCGISFLLLTGIAIKKGKD